MDPMAAFIAFAQAALPTWVVQVPAPNGIVAPDSAPEDFPPTLIVELLPGGGDARTYPATTAIYRLRFMAPRGIDARAAHRTVRALTRNPTTGLAIVGIAVPNHGYLRSAFVSPVAGPIYDPDIGTPTYLATATATWYEAG